MIIDVHNHIGRSGDGCESRLEDLFRAMEAGGVDRTVLFPVDDKAEGAGYRSANDRVLEAAQQHPGKIIPFCRVKPAEGEPALQELRRCAERGHRGVKLHPRSDEFSPGQAHGVLELAQELGLRVVIHTEKEENCRPDEWRPFFEEFQGIHFLITHGGKGTYRTLHEVIGHLRNVWVDTSVLSMFRTSFIMQHLGLDRIVYGTDFPYSHPLLETKKHELILSEADDRDRVFYRNALDFLGEVKGAFLL
ncbi:MAG: amidohydrolase family protein [Candidatus Omnitrophica bacterium]|nr:amidohydrolase family protein [Candidatus Omnitrophota bacterium]